MWGEINFFKNHQPGPLQPRLKLGVGGAILDEEEGVVTEEGVDFGVQGSVTVQATFL